jgi:hypothetical protein
MVFVKERKSELFWIRLTMSESLVQLEAALDISRRRQRGLYPRPEGEGFVVRFDMTGETGPRLTFQSLKGPDVTHPPPWLGGRLTPHWSGEGIQTFARPPTNEPSPLRDVAEPSRAGDFFGSSAHCRN